MGRNENERGKKKETKIMSGGLRFPPLQSLPLGFRFHPTDEELINHYLKGKISGRITATEAAVIPEVDLCRSEPWDLPDLSSIRSSDSEWFFFAAIDRKYPNGSRSNRATAAGYWKATGKDRFIRSKKAVVGMKKTLVFHRGRAPKGARSNWVMHEYRTTEPIPDSAAADQGGFVLCRLFKKSEEKTPTSTADEIEGSGLSPVSIQCLPDNMLHDADTLAESATQQNQELLESDKQPLTDATDNQTSGFGSEMSDRVDSSITCHHKPQESHCNSNITSDVDDYEADEVGPLLDDFDLEQMLATDFEPLGYPDFPEISSPILPFMNYAHQAPCRDFQDEMVQQDLTEFLGSLLKDPDSPEVSNFEPETVAELVPNGQVSMITHGSSWGLVSGKDREMNNDLDAEAVLAQEGLTLEDSGQPPFFSANSVEKNTSNRYNKIKSEFSNLCENEDPIWMYPPPLPVSTTEYNSNRISVCKTEHLGSGSSLNLLNNMEEPITQANSTGSGIMIRQHKHLVNQPALISNADQKAAATRRICMQHSTERPTEINGTGIQIRRRQHPDNSSTSSVYPTQQGMAARRIRLQCSTSMEGPTINKDLDSNEAKFEVNLETTKAEEHLKHQIMVDCRSNFVEVCHDDNASMDVKSTCTETYKGPVPKPVLRLRAIQVTNTEIKLEESSFKHKTFRIWRLAVVASLILVPLCVGISWFLTT